ncbi:ribonuclease H-like domain-containing protein [Tanacetum coccineum]
MLDGKTSMEGSLVAFAYRDLQLATKNFSEKLGGGGFGSVFKGVLCNSSIVAVIKLESISQGEKQFRSEVSTIGTIQHVNIVRLRGLCAKDFGLAKLMGREFSQIYNQTRKMTEQDSPPPTITAMKIPIIKKGEYDIWSMRMRQYICHTDHNLWDIIVDGDLQEEAAPAGEQSSPPAPKTAKQLTAKRNQERVKSILLLAIPDEYLLKFHNVPDAKSLWAAIKSRFGGNDESKKMQRNVLKHQFENFTTAPNESLDKAYDSQIALIMRNKPDIDQTDIDDLYNNLRVYEDEMKRSLSSTSNSQNLAFLSSENTSSTNEVSTASGNFGVNTAGGTSSTSQVSSTPGADEVRFIQKTRRNLDFKGKQLVTFDKSKVECYNYHRKGHFAKECKSGRNQGKRSYGDNGRRNATTNEPSSQALVAQDGLGGYD